MKTPIKFLIVAALAATLVTTVSAAPPGKGLGTFKKASSIEEIQKLKTGDRYALVCKECDTVTVNEVANAEEVERLCRDGGTLHCGSCKKKVTIKRHGPPGKGHITSKVTIVNAEGKECMNVVPLNQ